MGLTEVLRHLPRLLRLRARCGAHSSTGGRTCSSASTAPEFNLGLARRLKHAGLKTVQYVSPQVWAWRQGRVRTSARPAISCCACCRSNRLSTPQHGVRAVFVGPSARRPDSAGSRSRSGARAAWASTPAATVVALLPGQPAWARWSGLAADFAAAAAWLAEQQPGDALPRADGLGARACERSSSSWRAGLERAPRCTCSTARRSAALAAADGVIVASGTATLETLLIEAADGGGLSTGRA